MNSISQAPQITEYTYEVKTAVVNHYVLILYLFFLFIMIIELHYFNRNILFVFVYYINELLHS